MRFLFGMLLVCVIVAAVFYYRSSDPSIREFMEETSSALPSKVQEEAKGIAAKVEKTLSNAEAPALPQNVAKHFTNPEEFASYAGAVLQKMPRLADFRRLSPEEAHHTPKILVEAGAQLGEIASAVEADSKLAPQAFQFYENCSRQNDLPSSIRALCFSHYEEWGNKLRQNLDDKIVPESIRELANKLK